jgi:hypothetical protein
MAQRIDEPEDRTTYRLTGGSDVASVMRGDDLKDCIVPQREEWDTAALQRDYRVIAFCAPFVKVQRKSDDVEGLLRFEHSPRVYFDFSPLTEKERNL